MQREQSKAQRPLALLALTPLLLLLVLLPAASASRPRSLLLTEANGSISSHVTVPCNSSVLGSVAACLNKTIKAVGNVDYNLTDPQLTYPTDGTPWGIHLTGPFSDSVSYTVSWTSGAPTVGPADSLIQPKTTGFGVQPYTAIAWVGTTEEGVRNGSSFSGSVITYKRAYLPTPDGDYFDYYQTINSFTNYSYLSPLISHVVLRNLLPGTQYFYQVGDGKNWSEVKSFRTVPMTYPIRIALTADIGQTVNSSLTRDQVASNSPDVIINVGDLAYADHYHPGPDADWPVGTASVSNQSRWDSHIQMWTPLWSAVPVLNCIGNHEIEAGDINADLNPSNAGFNYPDNYPFQTYASRYPAPGVSFNFGNINNNLFYSTVIGGSITLVTLNNYMPFELGTTQYKWLLKTFKAVNRTENPWLLVQFHAAPYHTYVNKYKEMGCFMSVYEDLFYEYGVDMVINGHVHAYERTHPMYNYTVDTCGPVYVTVGDGGNVEGPLRNFVDEINPATNASFCAGLRESGKSPLDVDFNPALNKWTSVVQNMVQSLSCPTLHWEPSYSVGGGPPLVLLNNGTKDSNNQTLGFCQSSQPLWSAHRDPSFGHAILDVLSDSALNLTWYRNIDGNKTAADTVLLQRRDACAGRRRGAMRRGAQLRLAARAVRVRRSNRRSNGRLNVRTPSQPSPLTPSHHPVPPGLDALPPPPPCSCPVTPPHPDLSAG